MLAVLGTALSALGVLLALAGLFAAVSLLAARRIREFGIRLSLGARPADILNLVLRRVRRAHGPAGLHLPRPAGAAHRPGECPAPRVIAGTIRAC